MGSFNGNKLPKNKKVIRITNEFYFAMPKTKKLWEFIPEIEWLDIEKVTGYEHNAKKHPKSQIEAIAASITEFGWVQPIVIDKNNVVSVGHGRLAAARLLGAKKVPCFRAEHLSESQINELRIVDNKLNESEWDELELSISLKDLTGPVLALMDFGDLDFDMKPPEEMERLDKKKLTTCPNCGHEF